MDSLTDYDFDLPDRLIALYPARPRDSARMLVVRPGQALEHLGVRDLPALLRPGDALVFNDTRVIPARLRGVRLRGGGS
ncbi:MAG TPA: S-adenosylmethionine:tRNA ribosyltransferase-isomerase, partial [Beijerinckiaceae bacterium]|nr:S-adenosylmethionine:tRNA ribosyltransferase-isomerase [Beijerinckiaceae bacterium]